MTKKKIMRTYIGIDNGVTGSIGVYQKGKYLYFKTPVKKEQSYTKKKQNITRIDYGGLYDLLKKFPDSKIVIERPYVNPTGFKATSSALRALEATIICIEQLGRSYEYIDSKQWQKLLLPKGLEKNELKKASFDIGMRLFSDCQEMIRKQKDADGLLICEYAKRMQL